MSDCVEEQDNLIERLRRAADVVAPNRSEKPSKIHQNGPGTRLMMAEKAQEQVKKLRQRL